MLYREANTLDQLVRRSAALVIDRDLRSNVDLYGKPQFGSHLERYLVDAMRRLVSEGKWVPQRREVAPLAWSRTACFVLWPQAAADMIELLRQDQLPGIPKAPETIAEILAAAGVIEPRADGSLLWDIFVAQRGGKLVITQSRFSLVASVRDRCRRARRCARPLLKPAADKATHSTPANAQLSLPIPEPAAVAHRSRSRFPRSSGRRA